MREIVILNQELYPTASVMIFTQKVFFYRPVWEGTYKIEKKLICLGPLVGRLTLLLTSS